LKLINKNSGSFFTHKIFKMIDLPDTKNLKQISKEGATFLTKGTIKSSSTKSPRNSRYMENFTYHSKKKGVWNYLRKNSPYIVIVLLIMATILIFINT
jgi:hypothetical protein